MKKVIAVLCALAVFVSGCSSRPGGLTEETYRTGKNALEAIDQYLDGEITAQEAHDKINLYYDILDKHNDSLDENEDNDKLSFNCSSIKLECMIASYAIVKIDAGFSDEMESLLESRNDIAEIIGESTR